jgi:hypothetical protein
VALFRGLIHLDQQAKEEGRRKKLGDGSQNSAAKLTNGERLPDLSALTDKMVVAFYARPKLIRPDAGKAVQPLVMVF